MHLKKKVCLLITIIVLSTLVSRAAGSPNQTMSFIADGITVDVTYPEEAHPLENVTYSVSIKANTALILQSFALFIYAPVNSTLQEIANQTLTNFSFIENYTLPSFVEFQLPENTNGTVYCVMTFKTNQAAFSSTDMFFTTHVSELTFSEMQSLYIEMLANYTKLQSDFANLTVEYNELLANYTKLQSDFANLTVEYNELFLNYSATVENYTLLISQNNQLQAAYDSKVAAYDSLVSSNNQLSQDYSSLNAEYQAGLSELAAWKSDYVSLNTTNTSLRNDFTHLQSIYDTLNQTYYNLLADLNTLQNNLVVSEGSANNSRIFVFIALMAIVALVALIVYLKKKEPEPYVVIRKETVAVEPEENQEPLEED